MSKISGEVLEVGVDWITAIGMTPRCQEEMQEWASSIVLSEGARGNDNRPWRFAGYEGFNCGGIQVGNRYDSTCIRLSSDVAQQHWRRLYFICERVTRVDLMVTLRIKDGATRALARVHRQALRHASKHSGGPSVTLIKGNDGSGTVYLGKRTSDLFARAYLKSAESKLDHYSETIRFEVEFKGDTCYQVLKSITGASSTMLAIAGYVSGFFSRRGCELAIPSVTPLLISIPRRRTDNQRRLEWLAAQVRPSVELLIAAGCYHEILQALGLDLSMEEYRNESPSLTAH